MKKFEDFDKIRVYLKKQKVIFKGEMHKIINIT